MTPTRRTRRSNTTKKSKPSRVVAPVEDSSDEKSSDAGSVTRCVCGHKHNLGLMVQCDKCEVWQHCECIGLHHDKLPDHYYCDECQPENHQIIKTSSGRSKRLYNAGLVSTSTNNTSPSSSNSDKEDASIKPKPKRSTKRRKKSSLNSTTSTTTTTTAEKTDIGSHSPQTPLIEAKTEQMSPVMNTIQQESPVIEERSTRSRRTTKIPADTIERVGTTTSSAATTTLLIPELDKKPSSSSSSFSCLPPPPPPITTTTKSTKLKANNNRHSSSSATPQQQILDDFRLASTTNGNCNSTTPYWNFSDGRPTRESSPPAKIKYPSAKMSFSDMNKRAKQILECITRMQSEELKRLPPPTMTSKSNTNTLLLFQDNPNTGAANANTDTAADAAFNRPRSLSTSSSSSSLSSASTVPLLDDYATTTNTSASSSPSTPIPYKLYQQQQQQQQEQQQQEQPQEETSIEILERVSRELAKFQRKFGIVYQHHQHRHVTGSHGGAGSGGNASTGHAKSSTTVSK